MLEVSHFDNGLEIWYILLAVWFCIVLHTYSHSAMVQSWMVGKHVKTASYHVT